MVSVAEIISQFNWCLQHSFIPGYTYGCPILEELSEPPGPWIAETVMSNVSPLLFNGFTGDDVTMDGGRRWAPGLYSGSSNTIPGRGK